MRKITSSLIISTYNRPAALRLCLESVIQQVIIPDEVIIADDGSGEDTGDLVKSYETRVGVPLKHVWHDDEGYRLAAIRNKALAASNADYIIQVDGDLILHAKFVADHLHFAKEGCFVSGARAMLDPALTEKISTTFDMSLISTDGSRMEKKYNAVHNRLLSRTNYLFQRSEKNMKYVLGCNMAFWRKDLIKVNGYNEEFVGWGKEDNDLTRRLLNAGVKLRFIKFGAIVYHLHHNETPRPTLAQNEAILRRSIEEGVTYIEKGIDKHR